jgi:hypothetical protein
MLPANSSETSTRMLGRDVRHDFVPIVARGFEARRGVEGDFVTRVANLQPVVITQVTAVQRARPRNRGAIERDVKGGCFDAGQVFAIKSIQRAADIAAQLVAEIVVPQQLLISEHRAIPVTRSSCRRREVGFVREFAAGELLAFQRPQHPLSLGKLLREEVARAEEIDSLVIVGIRREKALCRAQRGVCVLLLQIHRREHEQRLSIGRIVGQQILGDALGDFRFVEAGVEVDEVAPLLERKLAGTREDFDVRRQLRLRLRFRLEGSAAEREQREC